MCSLCSEFFFNKFLASPFPCKYLLDDDVEFFTITIIDNYCNDFFMKRRRLNDGLKLQSHFINLKNENSSFMFQHRFN